jgi:hypothetical protein
MLIPLSQKVGSLDEREGFNFLISFKERSPQVEGLKSNLPLRLVGHSADEIKPAFPWFPLSPRPYLNQQGNPWTNLFLQ